MTQQDEKLLEEKFLRLRQDLAAVIVQNEVLKAELRAFRDLVIEIHGKTEKERDELFKIWAAEAESYYLSVQVDPDAALITAIATSKGVHAPQRAKAKRA